MTATPTSQSQLQGLTNQEAEARRRSGQGNSLPLQSSRRYSDIFRENIFTFINMVLFLISLVLIALGRIDDVGVIAFVISVNSLVNIVQEIRAKQKLDSIALLTRPKVTLVRDAQEKTADPNEIVLGDVLLVRPGDQIVVDGTVISDGELNMDESLLTGESDLISKQTGDSLYSGSFCVSGTGRYRADKVGQESYANQLTAGAKSFRRVLTPLQRQINWLVRLLLATAILLWLLAGISLLIGFTPFAATVANAAVIAGLVPSGLFLMISLAYALGSVRMADRNALIQRSNAVESLSNVNVICLDKTGTLTANRIQLQSVQPIGMSEPELRSILGDYAASAAFSNKTNDALLQACTGQKRLLKEEIPFASAYKWSAETFDDPERSGTYVLGAPDVLRAAVPLTPAMDQAIQTASDQGLRVLLFAHTARLNTMRTESATQPRLPADLQPVGLLFFNDELRPRVQETLSQFQQGGIAVKVISGDNPDTVAALATQAGLGENLTAISGQALADMSDSDFAQAADESTIFGRITPDQKARLVKTLQMQGKYVAMMGDGVNDVPSLKQANVGIAMESGSQVTRGVADMVLLQDSFEALPNALLEGQRIRNSIQDVTKISLVRVFAFVILMTATVLPGLLFPISIKHNAILTLLTEGIPTLGITIWAQPGHKDRKGLISSILPFVVPAMAFLALFSLLVYLGFVIQKITPLLSLIDQTMSLEQIQQIITRDQLANALLLAQNALVAFLVLSGLLLILLLKPPTRFWTGGAPLSGDWRYTWMALAMLLVYGLLLIVPGFRAIFDLRLLNAVDYLIVALLAFLWALATRLAWRNRWLERFLQTDQPTYSGLP